MRKTVFIILSTLVILLLAACSGNKVDDATAEIYIGKAEEVIMLLNESKYDELYAKFDSQMKTGLPVEQMGQLTPIIQQSGTFEKIDKSNVEEKDGYTVVVLVAKYSDINRVYTISFNEQDEVAGLFVK